MAGCVWGIVLALLSALLLVGCESTEERAERHFQSAVTYLEAGEADLALVYLRQIFQINALHRDARALYASTVRGRGRVEEAYGQYLRLVEQYPNNLEGRVALAEMAFDRGDWPEMVRHGERAVALAPDESEVAPLSVGLAYREGLSGFLCARP